MPENNVQYVERYSVTKEEEEEYVRVDCCFIELVQSRSN